MGNRLVRAWSRLNAELFRRLGPDRYAAWIHNAVPVLLDEDQFAFHFESTYVRDKMERLFRDDVAAAARDVTNRNVRLRFAVDSHSFVRPDAALLRDETQTDPGRAEATFATFVEGAGNRRALRAARAMAAADPPPFRTLLLCSASGLGKTHLVRAIGAELARRPGFHVNRLAGDQFARQFDYAREHGCVEAFLKMHRTAHALLVDDLQLLCGHDEAAEALLEVVSALEARRARIVLASGKPPRALEGLARAARARLRGELEVSIERPDTATGLQFLLRRAPPGTPPALLEYLASHVQSSHKDQLHCLARMSELGPPTPSVVRAVVGDFLNRWSSGLTYEDIARAAARGFGVEVNAIYSSVRTREASAARHACFYLARKLLGTPFAHIGDHFGRRDHATVIEACRKLARQNGRPRRRLRQLEDELRRQA
jgi:chromosomal replication initiator protein